MALRRSRRPVRHDDQPVAHLAELRPDQRVQPVQRVHARRRLGLQPGLDQPDEVPPPGRHARRRALQPHRRRRVPGPGDHRRAVELPDGGDRRQRARLPAARAGLRQPRRVPDEQRPRLRLRRRARLRRRRDGADDRPRLPAVGEGRRGHRPVRPLRREPRGAQQRHADAPRRVLRDPGRQLRGRGAARRGPGGVERGGRASASSTATATPRRRCSPRRGRSRS